MGERIGGNRSRNYDILDSERRFLVLAYTVRALLLLMFLLWRDRISHN